MKKSTASILKLTASISLCVVIIGLVLLSFQKPTKVKLDKKIFENNVTLEINELNKEGEYIYVGDTLAMLEDRNGQTIPVLSIYEGFVLSHDFKPGDVVEAGQVISKIKVDIIKIVKEVFKRTNYFWILLSVLLSLAAHAVRAVRWQMLFEPIGYKPGFGNTYGATLVMFLANLAFPRLGEVLRCSILARYEGIPIEKSIGTMITERAIDVVCLVMFIGLCLILQGQFFIDFYNEFMPKSGYTKYLILGVLAFAALGFFILYRSGKLPFTNKLEVLLTGLFDGVTSVKDLKRPWVFIGHTLVIWILYFYMIAVCFNALPETSSVTMLAAIPVIIFGSVSMVAVQGGLGLYPYFVSKILLMYGVVEAVGYAFGWIVWSAQTLVVIITGLIAYLGLMIFNKVKISSAT